MNTHNAFQQRSMDSAIVTINDKGFIQSVDRKTCELFGYTIEELQMQKVNILIPSPYKEQHDTYMQNYFETGVRKIIDKSRVVEGLHKDGSVFPITLSVTEVKIWNKRMFIGSIEPVIDKRLIIYTDVHGIITYCNRNVEELIGYTPAELFGKNVSTLMPSPHAKSHGDYIEKNYHGGGLWKMLNRVRNLPIKHKNGVVFLVSILVTKISTDGIDMFKAIIQTPPKEAVFTINGEGIIKACNFNFTEPMFGYTQKDLVGNTIGMLIPEMSKIIDNTIIGINESHDNNNNNNNNNSNNNNNTGTTTTTTTTNNNSNNNNSSTPNNNSNPISSPSGHDSSPLNNNINTPNTPTQSRGVESWLGRTRKVDVWHKDGSRFPVNLEIIKLQGENSIFSLQIKKVENPTRVYKDKNGNEKNGEKSSEKSEKSSSEKKEKKHKRKKEREESSEESDSSETEHKKKKEKRKSRKDESDSESESDSDSGSSRKHSKHDNNGSGHSGHSGHSSHSGSGSFYQPEMIGEYTLGKTLGRGNYGVVKLGTHISTKDEIAIKILYKEQMTESEFTRCKREIEILKQLCHPFINKLLNVLEKDDAMFILMEYCPGGDLFHYVNKYGLKGVKMVNSPDIGEQVLMGVPLSEEDTRRIFTQICLGIAHCHKLNIAHRDIKHKNILFDNQMNVKIIDFGLSNWSYQKNLSFCGTPAYASPEMLLGINYNGPEVDIWSLGVILYSLVTGRLPFINVTDMIVGKFTIPSSIPTDLQDLIKKMLTVDREQRLNIYGVLNHPWLLKDPTTSSLISQNLLNLTSPPQQQSQIQQTSTILPNYNLNEIDIAKNNIINITQINATATNNSSNINNQQQQPNNIYIQSPNNNNSINNNTNINNNQNTTSNNNTNNTNNSNNNNIFQQSPYFFQQTTRNEDFNLAQPLQNPFDNQQQIPSYYGQSSANNNVSSFNNSNDNYSQLRKST